MQENHEDANKQLSEFFDLLPNMKFNRALDVCCGDGILTIDLLHDKFKAIDMFDQCEDAIFKTE